MYERQVEAIAREVERHDSPPLLVGIDGPGASGKSTLARELAGQIDAAIVEADDFYRPSAERPTHASAGEHYDWHRLRQQVLDPLHAGQPGHYQRYDWNADALGEWRDVPAEHPVIVEGVYVLRTELRPFYDYSVWVDAPEELRLRRGLARDGAEARHQWGEWMAREREYVQEQRPDQYADRRVSGAESA